MAFCMWLAMANYTSVSMASPLWVNAPLLLSGLWWNFLAGMMVSMKATVTIGGNYYVKWPNELSPLSPRCSVSRPSSLPPGRIMRS